MAKNKFQSGDAAVVVKNSGGHNMTTGTELTIRCKTGEFYYVNENALAFYASDLDHAALTVEQLEKQIASKESDIAKIKVKIDYLKESGSDKFSIKEFKAYQTLKMLQNTDMSMMDRARKIAEMYN